MPTFPYPKDNMRGKKPAYISVFEDLNPPQTNLNSKRKEETPHIRKANRTTL